MRTATIIERLQEIQKDSCLNKNQFALRLGINPSNYSRKLIGKQTITDNDIKALYDVFGVNPDWMREGIGEKYVNQNMVIPRNSIEQTIIGLTRKLTQNKELISKLELENESILSQLGAMYMQLDKR